MSFINYLKERWITYLFLFFAFLFAIMVYLLDSRMNIRSSNASYILIGWSLLLFAFVIIDFHNFRERAKKFREYCQLNASSDSAEDFTYPYDIANAALVSELISGYENYRSETETKAAEEMEFITKWIHDVKVPISAARLILETQEDKLPAEFYQNMDAEIFSIEESIMRVFYEIKTNRFFDDYKISRVSTKKLIAQALKGYSNFFSYKRIRISIRGGDYEVLTDEKWSGYILSQFISNAVKYSPEEGSIIIVSAKDGTETTISVKNDGKGISDKDIGQIFKKGYTSSENRDGGKATGYGLYLSKRLGDLLGHRLKAESSYGESATFSLTFSENETLHQVTKL
jgi:Signal transduction histidine kinase